MRLPLSLIHRIPHWCFLETFSLAEYAGIMKKIFEFLKKALLRLFVRVEQECLCTLNLYETFALTSLIIGSISLQSLVRRQ